jgi:hypothetical protein
LLFRLCLSTGHLHPDYLEDALTQRQLEEWQTFSTIEPWGTPAADYHAGLTAWASLQPHSKAKKKPEDFMPVWGGKDPLSPSEYKERARAAYIKAGGQGGI